ncbi:roadblock/LC7 domain-containing protein [Dactylosporangium vinaceum]|uniref:Roadblock/LC7 domain-containing protein n=1 Tax=Dactylosporangium vinaceum TaxID=53362 RepID=A0ABV5M2M5_9ACTN|nr:roadblock/LC7 domain-containing protein [Dactylosporangium vinaceum]UAB96327.1 roadblock/LC7 domain-containing protein [Dactylosporangium vinaceum]
MTHPYASHSRAGAPDAPRHEWGFLLDQLAAVHGVAHAVAVSSDGLCLARSQSLEKDSAEQVAAFTTGIESLTRGIAKLMQANPVEQVVVDMAGGRIVVMAIGDGSILTVLAAKDAEMGQIAYEMAMLINRVGAVLTPQQRVPQRA